MPRLPEPEACRTCAALAGAMLLSAASAAAATNDSWLDRQRREMRSGADARQAEAAIFRQDYTNAETHLRALLAADPARIETRLQLMRVCDRLGKWKDGILLCDQILAAQPKLEEPRFYKAYMAAKDGNSRLSAATWLELAAYLPAGHPRRLEAYRNLVPMLAALGEPAQAVLHGQAWMQLETTPEQLQLLAGCELRQRHWRQAIDLLNRAIPLAQAGMQTELKTRLMEAYRDAGLNADYLAVSTNLHASTRNPDRLLDAAQAARRLGLTNDAIAYYRTYLDGNFSPAIALEQFYLLKSARRIAEGKALLESLLGKPGLPANTRPIVLYELAQACLATDDAAGYDRAMSGLLLIEPKPGYLYESAARRLAAGRSEEALDLFLRAAESESQPRRLHEMFMILANLCLEQGDHETAIACLELARDYGPADRYWLLASARAELGRNRFDAAFTHLGAIEPKDVEILMMLANLRLDRAEYAEAEAMLNQARAAGAAGEEWEAAMARVEFGTGRFKDAVERLLRIPRRDENALWLIGIAFYRLDMPGLALHHLSAIDNPAGLNPEERYALHSNRAYLYFNQDQYSEALADADAALAIRNNPAMQTVRLRTLARLGKHGQVIEESRILLSAMPAAPLPDRQRADILETMGMSLLQAGSNETAITVFSNALAADPERLSVLYPRGLARYKKGQFKEALADFNRYLAGTPAPPTAFWGDYGVALGATHDYAGGVTNMEKILGFYPFDLNAEEELGYQAMKGSRNRKSRKAFRKAIETHALVIPYLEGDEQDDYKKTQTLLKEEYTKLDRTFGLQVYATRAELDDEIIQSDVDTLQGAIASQAGLVGSWRPPWIGLRNEKSFDIFARGMANFQRRSFEFDPDSYQGGIGAVYKPLSDYNFNVSLERLFKIGDNSEDNWLWRNMLSLDHGERRPDNRNVWLTSSLYGEAAFYLEGVRRWGGYLDGRLGPAIALGSHFTLTLPQGQIVGRYQSNDADGLGTYGILGLGANLRFREGERKLTMDRFHIDLFAHYDFGRFAERPDTLEQPDFQGWIIGISLLK